MKELSSIKIGLWNRTSQKGNRFLGGKFNTQEIVEILKNSDNWQLAIFKNDYKKHPKAPDYHLVGTPIKKQEAEPKKVETEEEDFI